MCGPSGELLRPPGHPRYSACPTGSPPSYERRPLQDHMRGPLRQRPVPTFEVLPRLPAPAGPAGGLIPVQSSAQSAERTVLHGELRPNSRPRTYVLRSPQVVRRRRHSSNGDIAPRSQGPSPRSCVRSRPESRGQIRKNGRAQISTTTPMSTTRSKGSRKYSAAPRALR